MDKHASSNRKLASVSFPTIAAVVDGLLRLGNAQQAEDFLNTIAENFLLSKTQVKGMTPSASSIILWIRGYDLTPEESARGYTGNFAAISYKKIGEKWTLYPTKIFVDLKQHPHRKYTNTQKHPNWAHPILKAIKKGKTYKTLQAVEADLAKIHEQFPTATIPTKQCLYVMIFSRAENKDKPVQKYILEPKIGTDGSSYYINIRKNEGKGTTKNLKILSGGVRVKQTPSSGSPAATLANPVPAEPAPKIQKRQEPPMMPEKTRDVSAKNDATETPPKAPEVKQATSAKKTTKSSTKNEKSDPSEPRGRFTAREQLRRAKKRK